MTTFRQLLAQAVVSLGCEEKDTDDLLTQVAEQEVNPAALGSQAANDPSGGRRGAA